MQLQPTEDAPAQLHAVAALRSLVQLRMTCSLQWPMTAIVTADSQWHYSRIQTFLLQVPSTASCWLLVHPSLLVYLSPAIMGM